MDLKIRVSVRTVDEVEKIVEEVNKIQEEYPDVSTLLEVDVELTYQNHQ